MNTKALIFRLFTQHAMRSENINPCCTAQFHSNPQTLCQIFSGDPKIYTKHATSETCVSNDALDI